MGYFYQGNLTDEESLELPKLNKLSDYSLFGGQTESALPTFSIMGEGNVPNLAAQKTPVAPHPTQAEAPRVSPYDNLNSKMGLGNLNVGQFARLAGMAASAIDPNSPMGRMGAGVSNIAAEGERYNAAFSEREQDRLDQNKKYEAMLREKRMNNYMTMLSKKEVNPLLKQKIWAGYAADWNKEHPDVKLDPEMPMQSDNSAEFTKFVSEIGANKDIKPADKKQAIVIKGMELGVITPIEGIKEFGGGDATLKANEADEKYRNIIQRKTMKLPVSAEESAWASAYKEQKAIGAEAYGKSRLEVALTQPVAVVEKDTGDTTWVTKKDLAYDIGDARRKFMTMGSGEKAKRQTAIMEDIEGASANTRKSLIGLKTDFTQAQRAQFAYLLKSSDPDALGKFMQSNVASTLTPEQVDYITDVVQLKENAYALRTILGAGQGSDELRRAIADTLPGAFSPNRQFALTQLNKFDGQLQRLKKAYFHVNNKQGTNAPDSQRPWFNYDLKKGQNYTFKAGGRTLTIPAEKAEELFKDFPDAVLVK